MNNLLISGLFIFFIYSVAFAFPKRDFKLNDKINPCENLYEYVCSSTIKSFELPKTRSRHSFSFDDTDEYLLTYKKDYFKQLQNIKSSSEKETQIQAFYTACMDENNGKESEKVYVSSVLKQLEQIQTHKQFSDFNYSKMSSGDPSFISFWANLPNFNNSERMDGYFQIDVISLPDQTYYKNEAVTKDFKALLIKFFENIKVENPTEKANWVYDFEIGLAKVFLTSVEINKKVFSITEHSKALSKKLKNLHLDDFISKLPKHTHIRNLFGNKAFEFVDRSMNQLTLEQLKAIYMYRSMNQYLDDAYPEFQNAKVAFQSKHFGRPSERPDRAERCTKEIEKKFGMELDSILMPKLFPNFPKEKIVTLVEKVRNGLLTSIQTNKWLSPDAQKSAILKLKSLNIRIVSPESEQEWNFNKPGVYSIKSPIENRLLYERLSLQKHIENLEKKFPNPVWGFGPLTMNAALLPAYNAIIFPVAFLQPPFYDPEVAEEINLGGIGAVIGHELGHAIDDKGYTFDYKGRINPWLKKADEKKFFSLADPLIEQFNRAGADGKFTLGENIGDLVGLTNAYSVAFPEGSNKPNSLKKEFFIQYGKLWCEVQKPEFAELRKKTDPHAFGEFRANEQIKLQPGFAEAFGCKSTDPMVLPKEKIIRIW